MAVQVYGKRFNELALFVPKDVAICALRVSPFKRRIRGEIRLLCWSPLPLTYTELLYMKLDVGDDQAFIKKCIVAKGRFLGRELFGHRGENRVVPCDQAYQGGQKDYHGGLKRKRGQSGSSFGFGFQQENHDQQVIRAQPIRACKRCLPLPPPVAALKTA